LNAPLSTVFFLHPAASNTIPARANISIFRMRIHLSRQLDALRDTLRFHKIGNH
jgi:hypothetical protein